MNNENVQKALLAATILAKNPLFELDSEEFNNKLDDYLDKAFIITDKIAEKYLNE